MADFALIFDWDGVIINSEGFHRQSWELLAEEEGLALPERAFESSFGMRNEQIIPEVFHWAQPDEIKRIEALGGRKEALYREIIAREGIDPLPGVLSLLDHLRAAGIPAAVGSSTPRENIDVVMEILGVTGAFQAIVAAADVSKGKPDPEVFFTAAKRLDYAPRQCVVIEDAHAGIAAAKAGGFPTLAVATTHPAESLTQADSCHPDLTTVTVEGLRALVFP